MRIYGPAWVSPEADKVLCQEQWIPPFFIVPKSRLSSAELKKTQLTKEGKDTGNT